MAASLRVAAILRDAVLRTAHFRMRSVGVASPDQYDRFHGIGPLGLRNAKLDQATQISGFWKLKLASYAPIQGVPELRCEGRETDPSRRRRTASAYREIGPAGWRSRTTTAPAVRLLDGSGSRRCEVPLLLN